MFKKIAGVTPRQYARAVRDTTRAGKEADNVDITGESDILYLQDVDGLNHWVDLYQAQLDHTIIPDNFSMDDLIDWNHFDDMTITVKELDALGLELGT